MSGVEKSNPNASIESLPAELIASLLSHCHSLEDLSAIIHASPILYHGFVAAKSIILIALLSKDIGPGIRDALALAHIGNLDRRAEDYSTKAEWAIQLYASLPPAALSARGIATEIVVKMTQFNRTTRFFVDWFSSTTLSRLQREVSEASYPITPSERYRISQAIIRFQIMMNIYSVAGKPDPVTTPLHPGFIGLFRVWEVQQIWEFYCFIYFLSADHRDTVRVRHVLRAQFKRLPALESRLRISIVKRMERNTSNTGGLWFCGGYSCKRRSETDLAATPVCLFRVCLFPGIVSLARAIAEIQEVYVREQELPALKAGHGASDPPYAWVDAMAGLDCCRWGECLIWKYGSDVLPRVPTKVDQKMKRWRTSGFMFWDEGRVEIIKTMTPGITGFKTGWLLNLWDDVLD
ncbi:hypothetical protein F5Y08DRAFT_23482 [Xylaria arbuscula]|nr:hypothetical protein F5Y08DRAFT_23482 [Xylaria arbuscula]